MSPAPAMLALVTDAFGSNGGIAQFNRDLLGALAETAAMASITVVPRRADGCSTPLSKTIQQHGARRSRVSYSLMVLRLALSQHVDVVFCGHLYLAPLAVLVSRMKGAKLIVQTHGIESWARPSRLQRAALEAADLVFCVSRHTRAAVLTWAAIVPEKVLVLPNTVGEGFAPGNRSKLRQALGLTDKRVLLTVGRMHSEERYKGHDRVIVGIPTLVENGHDICYLVVGEGEDSARLEALACEVGVRDRVRFLGAVGPERLIELYRLADVFVMASSGEGFGIAFLEAMASGTPALGLDIGGAKDALADGELGVVTSEGRLSSTLGCLLSAQRGDPAALAAAVRARFGRHAFLATVQTAFGRLNEVT